MLDLALLKFQSSQHLQQKIKKLQADQKKSVEEVKARIREQRSQ